MFDFLSSIPDEVWSGIVTALVGGLITLYLSRKEKLRKETHDERVKLIDEKEKTFKESIDNSLKNIETNCKNAIERIEGSVRDAGKCRAERTEAVDKQIAEVNKSVNSLALDMSQMKSESKRIDNLTADTKKELATLRGIITDLCKRVDSLVSKINELVQESPAPVATHEPEPEPEKPAAKPRKKASK